MNDESISLQPNSSQLTFDRRADFLRAEKTRVGSWLATVWQKILLAVMLLEISLQLDTFLFHNRAEAKFGAISGFNISLTTICLVFLYLQWLPRLVVESKPVTISKPLTAYLAVVALSILWAVDKNRVVYELFLLLQGFMLFTYIASHLKTTDDVLFVMKFLVLGLLIHTSMMLVSRILDRDLAYGPLQFHLNNESKRVFGAFGSPNVASSFIAILLAPCLSLLFLPISRRLKLLTWITIFTSGTALLLTMSRGGWIAAAISLVIFFVVACRRRWLSGKQVGLLLICGGLTLAVLSPVILLRLFGDDRGSAASRMPLVELSMSIIAEHPLGVGSNNWDLIAMRQAELAKYREEWFYFVHNKYFLVLSEIGWLGLLAFLSFLGSILVCGWRALRGHETSKVLMPLLLGFTAAFFGQTFHMWFDIFNSRTQVQMICLAAGMIVGVAAIRNQPETTEPSALDPDRAAEGVWS